MLNSFLIIAGAEKAGTTSIHTYLSAHPEVCPSIKKETDFFRQETVSIDGYSDQFQKVETKHRICLESSPGYLAEAPTVAPRMRATVPNAKLAFLLRDPIERLYSSYTFYISRLHLPAEMAFDEFVDHCFQYAVNPSYADRAGLLPWHLNSLERSMYGALLEAFAAEFAAPQILTIDYDRLRSSLRDVIGEICVFAGIDAKFFDDYNFTQENVTFLGKNRALHGAAIHINNSLETFWRANPTIKANLRKVYRKLNGQTVEKKLISSELEAKLIEYYRADVTKLCELFPHLSKLRWTPRYIA